MVHIHQNRVAASSSLVFTFSCMLRLMCFSAVVSTNLRIVFVGVSAWAPTTARYSSSSAGHRRVATTFGGQAAVVPFLNIRGGTVAPLGRSHSSLSTTAATATVSNVKPQSSSSTALKASVADKKNSAATEIPEDESNEDNKEEDPDPAFFHEALELGLPVLEFGGLSYWKTTGQEKPKFRVLFVLGGPGAGKGTQSALMAENYPVLHLSVGQLLREEQTKHDSPHQKLIEEALVAGKIVPVEVSLGLVQAAMEEASSKVGRNVLFLIDGFPRNDDNLMGWCRYMNGVASLWTVLFYQCPLEELEKRILERAKNSGRSDDNLESIHKRFATFERDTMPIIRKLSEESAGKPWSVINIAGNQTLDEVWLTTQQSLNQLIRHDVLSANADLLQAVEQGDVETYKRLCDPLWFEKEDMDAQAVLEKQEGRPAPVGDIDDAELEFVSGKHVVVSYTHTMSGQKIREKRVWVYEGVSGWRNVHFARIPLSK